MRSRAASASSRASQVMRAAASPVVLAWRNEQDAATSSCFEDCCLTLLSPFGDQAPRATAQERNSPSPSSSQIQPTS